MDPVELAECEENGEDEELVDEFNVTKGRKSHSNRKLFADGDHTTSGAVVKAAYVSPIDVNVGVDGGYTSEGSFEGYDSEANEAIGSNNEELFEIRERSISILKAKKGKIEWASSARLLMMRMNIHLRYLSPTSSQLNDANVNAGANMETNAAQ
ncbi:uncharacterized protein A4U43_C04F7000 [Asparagus officinalis]|uniref:Uncharacterized protein n=1 Tax=Asparagus officinalis TaxID=4686 RepID=A0A5P1EYX0_ASPOF|nr:uncharacterized protein A4U43_C04F7000 [Asparagus officinalis]